MRRKGLAGANYWRRTRNAVVALLAFAVTVLLAPPAYAAGTEIFTNIQATVATVAKAIAGAMMIIGALIAGSAIIAGSQHAGMHTKNFFMGAAFLGLVSFGVGLYALVTGWFGMVG